jgi:hypothetical protein
MLEFKKPVNEILHSYTNWIYIGLHNFPLFETFKFNLVKQLLEMIYCMHDTIGHANHMNINQYIEPAKLKYRPWFKPVFQANIAGNLNYQACTVTPQNQAKTNIWT